MTAPAARRPTTARAAITTPIAAAMAAALATVIAIAWLVLRHPAISVDVATAAHGPLDVTIAGQGETRVNERLIVAAPVAGTVLPLELHAGDSVHVEQELARIRPGRPEAGERDAQLARVASLTTLAREAEHQLRFAEAKAAGAAGDDERLTALVKEGLIAREDADKTHLAALGAASELPQARRGARLAAAELRVARAGLDAPARRAGASAQEIVVRSPLGAHVLAIADITGRAVEIGAPLLTLGDARALEVTVDVRATDATRVRAGMPAFVEAWGGDRPLRASVRHVESRSFVKILAPGAEERLTRVVLELAEVPETLREGQSVAVRILETRLESALKVPVGALHRCGQDDRCVFVVSDGHALERRVDVAAANDREAAIASGITAGEVVVVGAPQDLHDGSRVAIRGT